MLVSEIRAIVDLGIELSIVIGGGNIFRGVQAGAQGLERVSGDYMGMLATIMNALALQDILEQNNIDSRVMSAIEMREVAEPYIRRRARRHLEKGRATTALLESLSVDYYGSNVPLNQLGLISAPEPRLLTVQVYDAGAIEVIEKSIMQSDLGLNPSRDGNLIRINVPSLTEDRRKELLKSISKMGEDSKIAVRNHRREANDAFKKQLKEKEISEDEQKKLQDQTQGITDENIKKIDVLVSEKEKEMMEV
ncbi:UNVERIFIED_CONTAM: hypothetical protein GTU68_014592 [Idotea baltica]|nr:hypothetical protein [Idotea baltica]